MKSVHGGSIGIRALQKDAHESSKSKAMYSALFNNERNLGKEQTHAVVHSNFAAGFSVLHINIDFNPNNIK